MMRGQAKVKTVLASVMVGLFLSGCAVGPDFLRPQTKAGKSSGFINHVYNESDKNGTMNRWWERLNDPLLDQYVTQLLEQNLQLVEAGERIVQARESVTSGKSSYAPTLSVGGNGGRSFSSNAGTRNYTNTYQANLNSSWELDLFGKIGRTVEAANARYIASVYDREALTHVLIAQLLNVRVEIAANKRLLELAQRNEKNRANMLQLVQRRYAQGARNTRPQDIYRAEDNLTSVKADVHRYQQRMADAIYRLDVLLGQTPGTTNPLEMDFPMMARAVDVPVCLPVNLLDRRPDLRASELRIKAANADIGVAIADLYPSLSFTGSLRFSGTSTGGLFSAEQLAGSLLGNIVTRLFEGGALRANIRIRESQARELAAGYAEDVLNAMREVETNLKADHELGGVLKNAQASQTALQKAEDIVRDRYLRGIDTLQNLLDTQRSLYIAEQAVISAQNDKWNARTSLYLALGGDWFGDAVEKACLKGKDHEQKQ